MEVESIVEKVVEIEEERNTDKGKNRSRDNGMRKKQKSRIKKCVLFSDLGLRTFELYIIKEHQDEGRHVVLTLLLGTVNIPYENKYYTVSTYSPKSKIYKTNLYESVSALPEEPLYLRQSV